MFRVSYIQRLVNLEGFLHSGVLTSKASYSQGFLLLGVLISWGSRLGFLMERLCKRCKVYEGVSDRSKSDF